MRIKLKRRFREDQAEEWWNLNKDRVLERYSPHATNSKDVAPSSSTLPPPPNTENKASSSSTAQPPAEENIEAAPS
ncbi:hypothetical protein KIW84_034014 [Lathyrus oleraceus]|uniref:BRX domain-containing protein n=1 Tax=Pisum sativum TaxID=3888 RepID=A0A9D5B4L1_PEA|nr:hypothetical protein KIW84_034014 [Pisum sativum]